MPNPNKCNRIADPAARRRCLKYQGEFAQGAGSNPGIQNQGQLGSRPQPRPSNPGSRFGGGRRGGGGWGQY